MSERGGGGGEAAMPGHGDGSDRQAAESVRGREAGAAGAAGARGGLFVTGTDTGVGKSIVSACLLAAARQAGLAVRAHKPAITGLDESEDGDEDETPPGWPADDELLAGLCGMAREDVSPLRYGPAVSPHLAAALAGQPVAGAEIVGNARESVLRAAAQGAALIVEGIGGLLVPLAEDGLTVRDLAVELALPVLIAARPGLGTINHTLLSVEAARAAGLEVRAVVITPWPDDPSAMERSNRETIAALGDVEVAGLPRVGGPDVASLAAAAAALPWRRWLSHQSHPPQSVRSEDG